MNSSSKKDQLIYGRPVPLLNSSNWNPDLHPRNSIGEFIYTDGGLHGRPASKTGRPSQKVLGPSAIQIALTLPINQNANRSNATATNPYFSHYGYDDDNTPDTNSNKLRLGNNGNTLTPLSLSISSDVARANRLIWGKPVYVNGVYLGIYDDSPASWVHGTIDVYDPNNHAGSQNWGGVLRGKATISSRP